MSNIFVLGEYVISKNPKNFQFNCEKANCDYGYFFIWQFI